MFPDSYFAPGFFPSSYWPPDTTDESGGGGGGGGSSAGFPVRFVLFMAYHNFCGILPMRNFSENQPPMHTLRAIRGQDLSYLFKMAPPSDITDWAISFVIAKNASAEVTKTVGSGITVLDEALGILRVDLAKANLTADTPSKELSSGESYSWALKRTDSGYNRVLAHGPFILDKEVIA